MEDDEKQEGKRKAQRPRKQKATVKYEEIFSSDLSDCDSSDCYKPAKDLEDSTSDSSANEIKRNVKKRKNRNYRNNELLSDEDLNDGSNNYFSKAKRGVKKNKRKTSNNGAQKKNRRKKSKGKGGHSVDKSTVQEIENIDDNERENVQQERKRSGRATLGPYSIIGHWYLASGFMKDLIALFEAFDKQDSWRFCAFAECWQKYKFSLIYRGRYSFKELLEFSQEICFWTKKMLSPNHKVKWRVGALYALYGLYYKHPFRYFYKIRMEMEAYENMVNLVRIFHSSSENPDPAFIFYKLTKDGAFHHVASSDEMGLHFHCPERQWETMKYEMQWGLQEHSSESIFSDHKCNIQKTLMEEYEKVKTEIWGNDGEGLDKAMTYVQPNILTEVRSVLAELHHDDRSKTVNSSQESIDGNQEHAASTEMSEIGQRKSEIRMKAASLCTTSEFLQRKLLRSPQKTTKKGENQQISESVTGSVSDGTGAGNLNVCDDNEKVTTLRKIMEFMQPPEEGGLPLKSLRTKKNKRMQNPIKDEIDYQFEDIENFDSEALLLNDSSQDGLQPDSSQEDLQPDSSQEDLQPDSSQEDLQPDVTSLQASQQKRGRKRKTVITQNESPIKKKPRKTSLPKQEKRSKSTKKMPKQGKRSKSTKKSSPRNSLKCEPDNDSQIEMNEVLESEKEPESSTGGKVLVNKKKPRKTSLPKQEKGSKSTKENNLRHESFKCEPRNNSQIEMNKKVMESESEPESLTGGKVLISNTSVRRKEEELQSHEENKQNKSHSTPNQDNLTHKYVKKLANLQSCNSEGTVSPAVVDKEKNLSENVCVGAVGNEDVHGCFDMNNVTKILQVEILATIPKKRSLQSTLKAKRMAFILVNFQEDNVKVHTVKFKMSKTDLKIIQNNREKLNALKKKLHSLLPFKYKNYDLHVQLNIHQSVMEEMETCEEAKHSTHRLKAFTENGFEPQTFDSISVKTEPSETIDNLTEPSETIDNLTEPSETIDNLTEPSETIDNLTEPSETINKIDTGLPHEEPMTSCTQEKLGSSLMTEDYHIPSSSPPEIHDDMNHIKKVVQVEIIANTEENFGIVNKTEDTVSLNVNFQVEGIGIHQAKFLVSVKDFETLLNNKTMLESLMKIFRSFLPPRYQMNEMQLHSLVQQSVTEGSIDALQYSRQGCDSSGILSYDDAATPFKANNNMLNTKAYTSPSQKGLSKNVTNSHSEASAAQVPQPPIVGKVKEYSSLRPIDQDQYNTNTTAQPTCLTLDPLCLQRTTKSPVNPLISEGSQQSESCSILSQNRDDNYIHVSNNPSKTQHQNLPHKIVSRTYGDTKPDIMFMDEPVLPPQVYRMDTESPAKLLDSERSIEATHVNDGIKNSDCDLINNSLDFHTSSDMHFSPKTNEIKKNTSLLKGTNHSNTETCTILWKTKSNLHTESDKNLLPSLPFSDCSSEHFEMVSSGQMKTVSETVRNIDHIEPTVSASSSSDTSMRGISSLPPSPHSPVRISSGNLVKSGRPISKANDNNTVCSYYFFSRTKKYDPSFNKQTRSSSNSDIKKPPVRFLFMEKWFSKKEH
ncbi:uncharacterized protein LOC123513008 [Portunus trituberculatus]|uniref:uncharacterized protein LOC123513008 n=1 Tax=Portunus trituberculatus TaxID=210409 RepID=UPI001E1CCE52|nr:uncharacterized protein LOC123513008 [Portunus trituberculatus]XP_045125750.1 uncharacterized protein LOC123513008 [Portunus trituberculatus]XP_045125751.1 uncharacterized protein LOC123513008 [Portunus trituberculatus]